MSKKIFKISLIIVFLVFIPFQAFFAQLFTSAFGWSTQASFWLTHWYEIFIIIFFFISLRSLIQTKTVLPNWQKFLFGLLALGVLSAIFLSPTISRGIEGYRMTLLFLLTLFTFSQFEQPDFAKFIRLYFILSVFIAAWAIIERFLPLQYWQGTFNFSADFGFGNFLVGTAQRSTSFLSGPNQLGTYLLPAAFLVGLKLSDEDKRWSKYFAFGIILLAISFTFSRAALVGLIAGLLLLVSIFVKDWPNRLKIIVFSVVIISIPICIASLRGNSANIVLSHGDSQVGHVAALDNTAAEMRNRLHEPIKLLLGGGLGTAGPIVLKYNDGIISESWYLQVLLELGVAGLVLWLTFLFFLLKELWQRDKSLFLSLVGVSVAALFLHTFADNPALSFSLFLLIGTALSEKQEILGAL